MKPLALYRQGLFCDTSPRMQGKLFDADFTVFGGLNPTHMGKLGAGVMTVKMNGLNPTYLGETVWGRFSLVLGGLNPTCAGKRFLARYNTRKVLEIHSFSPVE